MKKLLFIGALLLVLANTPVYAADRFFEVQSVDTMKYSRDEARSKISSPEFDDEIDTQVKNIAELGATHVSISTPYDDEFFPFLVRWVKAARRHKLKVWFRGNFSGWEEWFDYSKIDRAEHTQKVDRFILDHPDIFEDGDIFVSCPECENGGPGDPRETGDVEEYRTFLISEYDIVKANFKKIGKKVTANYYSMNGDVARLVMDHDTTRALDGIITVDHYVKTPEQLADDLKSYAESSGGKVVLGEFGAPIPDIQGDMTEQQQADYIHKTLSLLVKDENVVGVNYWVNRGGSTQLWTGAVKRTGADTLASFYRPYVVEGSITDTKGKKLSNVLISGPERRIYSDNDHYAMPLLEDSNLRFIKSGYVTVITKIDTQKGHKQTYNVIMEPQSTSWWDDLIRNFLAFFDY